MGPVERDVGGIGRIDNPLFQQRLQFFQQFQRLFVVHAVQLLRGAGDDRLHIGAKRRFAVRHDAGYGLGKVPEPVVGRERAQTGSAHTGDTQFGTSQQAALQELVRGGQLAVLDAVLPAVLVDVVEKLLQRVGIVRQDIAVSQHIVREPQAAHDQVHGLERRGDVDGELLVHLGILELLAAEQLSDTRTGALLVLERNNNLDEIIRTGTPMHADVIPEMLGTIFYEGTPLHDGAAILRDGRIAAAGCVLPLSNNLEMGKDMGTRHRAGLGMSENSDAIVVVVSEETGIISLAKNGVLIRRLDRQNLFNLLQEEIIPPETAEAQKQPLLNRLLNKGGAGKHAKTNAAR